MRIIAGLKSVIRRISVQFELGRAAETAYGNTWQVTSEYREYVNKQLERTLIKRRNKGVHTYILIDEIAERIDLTRCNILCVGSRNMTEVDYFREKGSPNVKAIDLYSDHPDIRVMDMHKMVFSDNTFDVVFSSHALEHAYDPDQVIKELARVCRSDGLIAIEVPVNFKATAADRIDFGDLKHLHSVFDPYIKSVLWSEAQSPETSRNIHAVAIIRTIMTTI